MLIYILRMKAPFEINFKLNFARLAYKEQSQMIKMSLNAGISTHEKLQTKIWYLLICIFAFYFYFIIKNAKYIKFLKKM